MKRLMVVLVTCGLLVSALSPASASTISFTASDVKNVLSSYGASLDTTAYYYGITGIRVMPIVTGSFTLGPLVSDSTTATGWEVSAGTLNTGQYTVANSVEFHDIKGAWDNPSAVYMITSKPDGAFGSSPTGYGDQPSGKVADTASFSFSFTLASGSTWAGAYQFLVDGNKFAAAVPATFSSYMVGGWEDFYELPGNGYLDANTPNNGYQAPLPSTLLLLGSGLGGLLAFRRRQWLSR